MANAIWMVHAPPHGGHADLAKLHGHVGSVAIRQVRACVRACVRVRA